MAGKRDGGPVAEFFAQAAEAIALGVGDAATDIRHKLVEEPWFGREVTSTSMAEQWGWATPADKARAWDALCDRLAQERGQQPAQDPTREHDLER